MGRPLAAGDGSAAIDRPVTVLASIAPWWARGVRSADAEVSDLFFLFRFLRDPAHPQLKWGLAVLLLALGVGLIIWGLVGRNPLIAIRGAVELVIVGLFLFGVLQRRRRLSGGPGNSSGS